MRRGRGEEAGESAESESAKGIARVFMWRARKLPARLKRYVVGAFPLA